MARIGPNAVTRLAGAAEAQLGPEACSVLFAASGLGAYRTAPPETMVDEDEVVSLYATLDELHPTRAVTVARDAGHRTAQYLLAHRIPQPVQWLLHALPAGAAARVLVWAISRHAWTFAGSGRFHAVHRDGLSVTIEGGPFADPHGSEAPLRAFYSAVFETLFTTLVSRRSRVEVGSAMPGACRFAVRWCTQSLVAARAGGPIHG